MHSVEFRIRSLVVDDEPLARNDLCRMLGTHQDVEIVGQCGTGSDALAVIRERKPDLVFLDVQMPECDGFEVLERLGPRLPAAIVFVTAYDQYALRAFEAGALDYLLKPFDEKRFRRALKRACERISAVNATSARNDTIAIRQAGEVVFLRAADIDWIESADYYACLHVGNSTHVLRRSLSDLEEDLSDAGFVRIHRSAIINLARVTRLTLSAQGDHELELRDGARLRVSRRHRRAVLERLGLRNTQSQLLD